MEIWKVELRCKIEDSPGPPAYIYWYKVKDTIIDSRTFLLIPMFQYLGTFPVPKTNILWRRWIGVKRTGKALTGGPQECLILDWNVEEHG